MKTDSNYVWKWKFLNPPTAHLFFSAGTTTTMVVTKQSNTVTSNEQQSNEKTSNGIKIQEVKKNPYERKNIKTVVIS